MHIRYIRGYIVHRSDGYILIYVHIYGSVTNWWPVQDVHLIEWLPDVLYVSVNIFLKSRVYVRHTAVVVCTALSHLCVSDCVSQACVLGGCVEGRSNLGPGNLPQMKPDSIPGDQCK